MSGGIKRSYATVSAIIVIGIILVGTGLILYVPDSGNGTTTTTDPTTTTPNTTEPVGDPNPFEVAIVFIAGGLGDGRFNDFVYEGVLKAHEDYNINFTYAEPMQLSDYEPMIRNLANHTEYIDPYKLIICIAWDQVDALLIVAEEYPEQEFAVIDPLVTIDSEIYPNVASVNFVRSEAGALVGVIAGLMTETDSIGFLGGMEIALINAFTAGYVWGANLTNPGINYTLDYTNTWIDINMGKTLTKGMYAAGVDIVYQVAAIAGYGAFDAAKEDNETSPTPLWVIGSDVPQMYLGCLDPENPTPPTVGLTSALLRMDVAIYDLMYEAVLGIWVGGNRTYDISNDGVNYEINTDLLVLPQSVIDTVEMIATGIVNGTYIVPHTIYW
ncbi:MAG: BMP family protein [Candidatus Thorarchaeota archaeon]